MSAWVLLQKEKLNKRTGTPLYMAPELFMRYYGVESDQVSWTCYHSCVLTCYRPCVCWCAAHDNEMVELINWSLLQWALGIMMYQLLSGHLPFWDEESDRSPFAVMSAILSKEVRSRLVLQDSMHVKT